MRFVDEEKFTALHIENEKQRQYESAEKEKDRQHELAVMKFQAEEAEKQRQHERVTYYNSDAANFVPKEWLVPFGSDINADAK